MTKEVSSRQFPVVPRSPQTLHRCSFTKRTNDGIRTIISRIAVVLVLCCVIVECQGRQSSLSASSIAFVQTQSGSKIAKVTPFDVRPPTSVLSTYRMQRPLFMSSEIRDDAEETMKASNESNKDLAPTSTGDDADNWLQKMMSESPLVRFFDEYKKPPPFQVEDTSLLFYDVFLLLNLSLSISFWAVHRMSVDYIGSAVSEGSLFCLLWIAAGLVNGAFLYSAVDGHYRSGDERGGPKAAGLLGLQTFIGASNLRILVALVMAFGEHRKVGTLAGEQLIPLEIVFGLMLMSMWRALHSTYTPRV